MREQFLKAFEPKMAVKVESLEANEKEELSILGKLINFFDTDYYHITDSTTKTIYLKKKGKEKT